MAFEYLTNVALHQARQEYMDWLQSKGFEHKTETVPVYTACGRITAKAVYASISAPH